MNKTDTFKKITVTGLIVTTLVIGTDFLVISDREIQTYLEDSLINGCRPIVDICSSNCGSKEINLALYGVSEDCILPESEIIRVPYYKVIENYIKLGRKYGIENTLIQDLPIRIREEIAKQGRKLQEIKEPLIIKKQ